jgi:hypothetical protein
LSQPRSASLVSARSGWNSRAPIASPIFGSNGKPKLHLGYGAIEADDIGEGLRRLGRAFGPG